MKLSFYLSQLKRSSPEDLGDLGISSHYPICLGEDIYSNLLSTPNYRTGSVRGQKKLEWIDGSVLISFSNRLDSLTNSLSSTSKDNSLLKNHFDFQKSNFRNTIYLNPNSKPSLKSSSPNSSLSRVLENLLSFADSINVGICLPRATNFKNILGPNYTDYIVYSDSLDSLFQKTYSPQTREECLK